MKKIKTITYIFIFLFVLLNINLIYGITNAKHNLENYFRLHVLANSDSISDQMLKLKVTEEVNKYIQNLTKEITCKEEYIYAINNDINNILQVAKNTILDNNSSYNVTAYIGNIKYKDKSYNNNTMKAGTYNSLKIVIGDGDGENWWSLLYPSMSENLTIDEVLEDDNIKFESKIFEWLDRHLINNYKIIKRAVH